MDLLTRIRNTTAADLEGVRSDFDDLPTPVYRSRVPQEMVRIVPGADDLKVNRPAAKNPGMIGGPARVDTRPYADQQGLPTERQREFIDTLMVELKELDAEAWADGMAYIRKMSENRAWTPGRGGNVSRWIDSLKAKLAALRHQAKMAQLPGAQAVKSEWLDIPTGYYALRDGDSVKFYRVNHHQNGRTYLDACASDDRHPIRNAVHKKNILTAIRAMGWGASTALYGQEIGSCGRCGRTLTDDVSRAAGIGPKCRKDM